MAPDLPETCTLYTVTRDRYGDFSLSAGATINCLFRDTSKLMTDVNHREEINILGTFWFAADSGVDQNSIVKYNGTLYRMESVTNAKDLLFNDQVQFIKAQASYYRAIS